MTNMAVTAAIFTLAEFSRFDSLTSLQTAVVIRLAFTQFLNTAVLPVLIHMSNVQTVSFGNATSVQKIEPMCIEGLNATLPELSCLFGDNGIFFRGSHYDLGPRWYKEVGGSIVFTMIMTTALRPLAPLIATLLFSFGKRFRAKAVRHVEAMKALYIGPDPRVPFKLGQLYAFSAVCITFSSLLPVLHIVMFIYSLTALLVDKWFMLSICRTPVPYSPSFVYGTLWWVQWVLMLKLLVAFWAYGSLPGTYVGDAITEASHVISSTGLRDIAAQVDGGSVADVADKIKIQVALASSWVTIGSQAAARRWARSSSLWAAG